MNDEIKSGSKLLAEFEGWMPSPFPNLPDKMYKFSNDGSIEEAMYIDHCAYHTDYNELHRVWIRFRDLDISKLTTEQQGLYYTRRGLIANKIAWQSHQKAFEELVEAVTWYNSLKPKEEKK